MTTQAPTPISDERLANAIQVNDDWIAEYQFEVSEIDTDIALALRELQAARLEIAGLREALGYYTKRAENYRSCGHDK